MIRQILYRVNSVVSKIIWSVKGFPGNCIIDVKNCIVNSTLEGRNKIDSNCVIRNSKIGYGTFIASNSILINCKIGKYSLCGFQSLIGAHPLHTVASVHPALYSTRAQYGFTYVDTTTFEEYHYADNDGNSIVIGNDCWITAGTTKITQGVTIGDGAVVLADAVVTKDVPPYAIVGGIPAKIVGYRFTPEQIEWLLSFKWWDKGEEWIKHHSQYFSDIEILMQKVAEEMP